MGYFGIFGVLFDGRSVQQEVQERVGLDTGSGESERPCRRESGVRGVGGSGGGCVEATCPAECDVTRFTLAVLSRRALGG